MSALLSKVVEIARGAGVEILDVYNNRDFNVEMKGDGSPLTEADRRAHRYIEAALIEATPDIPVLSEESGSRAFEERRLWSRFWLVDPLDGTKEFVRRNGEFTVNIALIDEGKPVMGVVHTPVQDLTHFADIASGAYKQFAEETPISISTRSLSEAPVVMVASRSHAGEAVNTYRVNLEAARGAVEIASMGSSLKLCLVAEGKADIYPRLGPTSEWDTAAAHCVVEAAGGGVIRLDGQPLEYNKPDILNPWFLVYGDSAFNWIEMLPASVSSHPN